ncbi:unnamed protein product [Clonostachys rosea]|uniref:RRM domain-containing protein n=1 Tax=Bionectria ochroleuca TaxID=29856 RepID=A0ABY6UZP0_BIOOC|nr:unnamed protein product [Clonostachys rosea]
MSRQDHVSSASITEAYYLKLNNLPPHTRREDLEAFVSRICEVDRVFIVPKTGQGWVCVKHKHNFHRAYECLHQAKFGGRTLLVAEHNKDGPIFIRVPLSVEPDNPDRGRPDVPKATISTVVEAMEQPATNKL